MDGQEFFVSQSEAYTITGRGRTTLHTWRQEGLPYRRDEKTGRVYYREADLRNFHKNR